MKHEMKVQTKYYRLLKSGQKTLELRLWDEKRRQIKVGDEIRFSETDAADETFTARVIALHLADNFTALSKKISPRQAGFDTAEELIGVMEKFYPLPRQQEMGVVGIEIKVIH